MTFAVFLDYLEMYYYNDILDSITNIKTVLILAGRLDHNIVCHRCWLYTYKSKLYTTSMYDVLISLNEGSVKYLPAINLSKYHYL